MDKIFDPEYKTIKEIFEGSFYYQIPPYQRRYSWEDEHVEKLWDDVYTAFENQDEEYFLGSIILTINKEQEYFNVVDGQQRLTTLTILFCCLRDLYYKNHKDLTKRNLILGRIKNLENDEERLKLITQHKDQTQFEQEIIKYIDFSKAKSKNELKANKFINTAYIFKGKIEQLKNENISKFESFTEYLLKNVSVIIIKCSKESFAIRLFQVLNTRGLDLSPADLIKSYLMERFKNGVDRKTFEQDWIYFETKAKEFKESSKEFEDILTDLLTYYEYYLLASNPKRTLYEELETKFNNIKDPKDIVYEFKRLINYFDQMDDENSKIIYALSYLRHDVYWKSILLTAKMKEWNDGDFVSLAKLLRKFYYLYWISDYTTSKTKQTSFNIISWIKEGKDINFIKDKIYNKIKEDKVISRAIENLNNNNVYDRAWLKPLLVLIEYNQTDDSNTNYIIDKNTHVEHILPQGFQRINYWKDRFTKEDGEELVNSLSNLTLLSGKKNIEASNNSFEEKLKVYKGKGIDGTTGFRITENIIYEWGKDLDWNKNKISNRKIWMINDITKIFDVSQNELTFNEDLEYKKEENKTELNEHI